MAIKLADTLAPMADFPAVEAQHVAFDDGDTLQEKLDNGGLGGGGTGYKQLSQAEYDALTEDEKMNGKEYRTYDTGHIYKLGVEYGKDAYFTSLSQLGLTADATLDDVIATMPKGSSALIGVTEFTNAQTMFPYEETNDYTFGRVYIVKGSDNGRIYAKWFRKDGAKEYIAKIDINTNAIIGWNKQNTYTTLSQLGLTADGTVNDIIAKLSAGESALINVAEFNDKTQFPDTSSSNNMATVSVRKTNEIGRTVVEWFKKDGRYAVAVLDGNNKVSGWREYGVETKKGLAQNSQYYKIDITKKGNKYRNGVVRFSYNNGNMPCEVAIFLSYGDSTGHIGNYTYTYGTNCIQSITLTGNDTNVVIGIELTKTVYGTQLVEVNDSFCTINNLTAEQFTGDTVATYNDSSKEILHTDLSGNLAGITTVLDLVNALVTEYRATSPKKPIRFVSGEITKTTLTDLPRNYGLLQITVSGYDVVDVSFAGSSFGFKTLHYGFVNRTSGETLFSSLFWEIVDTPVTELIDLGLDGSATIQNVMDAMTIGQHCILNTSRFDDKTQVDNIEYGKVEIRRLSSGMWSLWLEDVLHGNVVAHGTCSASKFAGWHYLATTDYVDNGGTFNGKTVKTVTIDLSASDLQYSSSSGFIDVSLANYVANNTKIIRVEGCYIPPSDNTVFGTYVPVFSGNKSSGIGVGKIYHNGESWRITVAASLGQKGSGFMKLYYIE